MPYLIASVLVILWLVGLMTSHTLGSWIHVLLFVALMVVLVGQPRRT